MKTSFLSKFVYGIQIRECERNRLSDGKWYNDTIMEVYLTYLQYHYAEKVIFFTAFESSWLSGVHPSKTEAQERLCSLITAVAPPIIVCVRHGGNHWWCEIYNTRTMTLFICNTIGTSIEDTYAHESPQFVLSTIFGDKFDKLPRQSIQQHVHNTWDCGPLVLWTLSPFTFLGKDSSCIAKKMRYHVANGAYYHFLEGRKKSSGLDGIRRFIFKRNKF
jgi:hypothetical protein